MRIVIGEDEVLLRDALVRMLTGAGHEVVGVAGDGPGLVRRAQTDRPELVVADVRMPPTRSDEGLRAVRVIRAGVPGMPVLVISHHLHVRYAVELLTMGVRATGYLPSSAWRTRRSSSRRSARSPTAARCSTPRSSRSWWPGCARRGGRRQSSTCSPSRASPARLWPWGATSGGERERV